MSGIFRWAVIAMAAVNGVSSPPPLSDLLAWMVIVGLCATVVQAASELMAAATAARAARGLLLADVGFVLMLLALYGGCPPEGLFVASASLLLTGATLVAGVRGVTFTGAVLVLALGLQNVPDAHRRDSAARWVEIATESFCVTLLAVALAITRRLDTGPDPAVDIPTGAAEGGRVGVRAPGPAAPPAGDTGETVRLTNREREVLSLVASGYSNVMIASRLHVAESTVKGHVQSILTRLNAHNRAEAVALAVRLNLMQGWDNLNDA